MEVISIIILWNVHKIQTNKSNWFIDNLGHFGPSVFNVFLSTNLDFGGLLLLDKYKNTLFDIISIDSNNMFFYTYVIIDF